MLQKYHVRKEMIERIKQDIPSSELTAITWTSKNKTDFDWRDSKEFKYKGMMYDVVKTKKVNSEATIYYCLTDHLEMKLLTKLEAQKEKNSKQDKNNPTKEVIKLFFKVETSKLQYTVSVHSKPSVNIKIVNFYDSRMPETWCPPPNFI